MKLNPRERLLLLLLGVLAVLAISYYFLIKPQLDRLDLLALEEKDVQAQIQQINIELASSETIDAQMQEYALKIEEMTKMFYPEILKEKLIVTFEDLILESGVKNRTQAYNRTSVGEIGLAAPGMTLEMYHIRELAEKYNEMRPKEEAPEAEQLPEEEERISEVPQELRKLQVITVKLQLEATYEQLVDFIEGIEALERSVIINNLVIIAMFDEDEQKVSANMDVIFYALPKFNEQDEEYYEWEYNNNYGKENPFFVPVV